MKSSSFLSNGWNRRLWRLYEKPGHYALTNKKDGKTVLTGTVDFSADNKSRTVTTNMTDAAAKKQKSIAVYDRQ
jgi:hypothetical protein